MIGHVQREACSACKPCRIGNRVSIIEIRHARGYTGSVVGNVLGWIKKIFNGGRGFQMGCQNVRGVGFVWGWGWEGGWGGSRMDECGWAVCLLEGNSLASLIEIYQVRVNPSVP